MGQDSPLAEVPATIQRGDQSAQGASARAHARTHTHKNTHTPLGTFNGSKNRLEIVNDTSSGCCWLRTGSRELGFLLPWPGVILLVRAPPRVGWGSAAKARCRERVGPVLLGTKFGGAWYRGRPAHGTDHMVLEVPGGPTMDSDLCPWPGFAPVRPPLCPDHTRGHDQGPEARGSGEAAGMRLRGGRAAGGPAQRRGSPVPGCVPHVRRQLPGGGAGRTAPEQDRLSAGFVGTRVRPHLQMA